jgi:N-formylglutamate amidohydrolase
MKAILDQAAPFPAPAAALTEVPVRPDYLSPSEGPPPLFDQSEAAFEVFGPSVAPVPILFASPHSGRRLPKDFIEAARWPAPKLAERIGRLEDRYVDELFDGVWNFGGVYLKALVHRAYVDLNREPYELDQSMFADMLPEYANTRSPRVLAGLGAIARAAGEGGDIYARKLSLGDLETRLERVHRPYHDVTHAILQDLRAQFGFAVLLDCHSMPSGQPRKPADIVLGDRYGASCAPWVTDLAQEILGGLGFSVARNNPYAGGYITQTYGAPKRQVHALQLELRRDLYMDEETLEKHEGFERVRLAMAQFSALFCDAIKARSA